MVAAIEGLERHQRRIVPEIEPEVILGRAGAPHDPLPAQTRQLEPVGNPYSWAVVTDMESDTGRAVGGGAVNPATRRAGMRLAGMPGRSAALHGLAAAFDLALGCASWFFFTRSRILCTCLCGPCEASSRGLSERANQEREPSRSLPGRRSADGRVGRGGIHSGGSSSETPPLDFGPVGPCRSRQRRLRAGRDQSASAR